MRKTLTIAAIALLAPAAASAALAANWYRVAMGDTAAWYVDTNSIKANGPWTAAREYSVNFEVSARGVKTASSDVEIDCKARTMRYLHFSAYNAAGAETASLDKPDQLEVHDIEASTVSADIADFICNVDRGKAVRVADPKTDNPPRS